jgi:riboflavin transporter FmnP
LNILLNFRFFLFLYKKKIKMKEKKFFSRKLKKKKNIKNYFNLLRKIIFSMSNMILERYYSDKY